MSLCFVVGQSLTSFTLCRFGRTLGSQRLAGFTNLAAVMYSHRIHLLIISPSVGKDRRHGCLRTGCVRSYRG